MKIDYELRNITSRMEILETEFDLFIYAIGYEKRSGFIRSQGLRSKSCVAIDYGCHGVGSYDENLVGSEKFNDPKIPYKDREILATFVRFLMEYFEKKPQSHKKICLDISCLDRTLMSYVMLVLVDFLGKRDEITFAYTPAKFVEPPLYLNPLKRFGPAVPELSGVVGNPYKNRALIMGLGYEYGAALNVFNIMEPQFSHLFYPIGDDDRFLPHVRKANFQFEFGLNEYKVSSYKFADSVTLHGQMRDIIYSLLPNYSIMIVPFGPKLFSALGILLCINNRKDCSFMRYSVQRLDDMPTIESSGELHGFTMRII